MRQPLFLARKSYRLRRLVDAARLLPFLGAFLFILPVFWRDPASGQSRTAPGAVFLFIAWAGLIAASALIARRLARTESGDPDGPGAPEERQG
ncbi:hypothetical protein OU426_01830 [Frigidibacter sp. RF13]|uniref:hypothetical protein n=1 Tax=Frigidibacter sp. RF13 TaxID=2997340 RepID=UPI00226E1CDF|nr:hypothetical protein [Frigidibacter sp. RF13]MCY1125580.1 hypothetical protein [Frigidibacter sp. RF13]